MCGGRVAGEESEQSCGSGEALGSPQALILAGRVWKLWLFELSTGPGVTSSWRSWSADVGLDEEVGAVWEEEGRSASWSNRSL